MSPDEMQSVYPSRENLHLFRQEYLKVSKTWFTPDVLLLTAPDGVRFVLKDWNSRPYAAKASWCRVAAAREMAVYRRLRGMQGIPQLITELDKYGFVMEWLNAQPLPSRRHRHLLGPTFFDDLNSIIFEMHSRGVAHGDLRRQNILQGEDGRPRLIDFETAVRRDEDAFSGLFDTVSRIDIITVLKIKTRYYPENITAEDQTRLQAVPWHLAAGRFFRKKIYGRLSPKRKKQRDRKRQKKEGIE